MNHNQKIFVITIFGILYAITALLVFREDHHARVNFQACPLCEK